jgi:hypothetical protein
MGLPKRATTGAYDHITVNVWDLATKTIVFTGCQKDAAHFMGIDPHHMGGYLGRKTRVKKKYAVRIAKQNQ